MNPADFGWKPPTKAYALGIAKELELADGTILIFKGSNVFLGCSEDGKQLYFFRTDKGVGEAVGIRIPPGLRKAFTDFHWKEEPKGMVRVKHMKPSGDVEPRGLCIRIDYGSNKGGKYAEYTHKHHKPYPILAFDPRSSQPYYLGGAYTVEERGIVA